MNEKGSSKLIIVLVLLIILVLSGSIFLVWKYFNVGQDNITKLEKITRISQVEDAVQHNITLMNRPVSCEDECSARGLRKCFGNGYKLCGNFDLDICYEWSSKVNCDTNEKCNSGKCFENQNEVDNYLITENSEIKYNFDEVEIISVEQFKISKNKTSSSQTWANSLLGDNNYLEITYAVFNLKKDGQIKVNDEEFLKVGGENDSRRFLLDSKAFYNDGSERNFFWSAKKLIGDDVVKDKTPPVYSVTLLNQNGFYSLSFSDDGLNVKQGNEKFDWTPIIEIVCEDTDGGNNPYVLGSTLETINGVLMPGRNGTDYCNDNFTLTEYICTEPFYMNTPTNKLHLGNGIGHKCEMGCKDGVCVNETEDGNFRIDLTSQYCDLNQNKCWVSDKVNAEITAEVFVDNVNNLTLKIFDLNNNLILDKDLTSPKDGKFMTTFDFLEKSGIYHAKIFSGSSLLYSFEIESVSFNENLRFSSVKSASGKKITLAYYSQDYNLDELKEFASVSSGYTGTDGLLNFDFVSSYKNNFEIVAITAPKDTRGNLLVDFIDYSIDKQNTAFVVYIRVLRGEEGENRATGGATCSMSESGMVIPIDSESLSQVIQQPFNSERTVAHEFGHSFACLGDEYFETPGAFQFDRPNIDSEGCPKWCSGSLDVSKPEYSNYSILKSCLSNYLDPQTNLFKNYDADKENIDNCFYTTIIEKGNPVVVQRYPDKHLWDFGTNCVQGTGCFFTANGLMEWRSQETTIMRDHLGLNADFGVIGKRAIGDKLRNLLE